MAAVVKTSFVENRNDEPLIRPVWEIVLTWTWTAGDGDAEIKHALPINGILQKVIVVVGSDFDGGTVSVAIDDNNDDEIFAVSSLAQSSTNIYNLSEPVSGTIDIGVDPTADPATGSDTVIVTLRGI